MTNERTPDQNPGSPETGAPREAPLQSWKEIAAHLERDERTARRWEREEGLPVRRHRQGGHSSVYAYPSDLDAWRKARKPKAEEIAPQKPLWRWAAPVLVGAFIMASAVWIVARGPILNPPDPLAEAASGRDQVSVRRIGSGPGVSMDGTPSPDGRYLSFAHWDTGNLGIRDLESGEIRLLTDKGDWYDSSEFNEFSVISPDGKQVAYTWFNGSRYDLRVIGFGGVKAGEQARVLYKIRIVENWYEEFRSCEQG